jgi:hypothetical protein
MDDSNSDKQLDWESKANIGRSARTNPSYERIDPYLEPDLTLVENRDLSVQSKVKAGSLGQSHQSTNGRNRCLPPCGQLLHDK